MKCIQVSQHAQDDADGDEVRSDVQEGAGSEIARTVPIQSTGLVSVCA